jgi:hypothetical protein
MGSHPGGFTIHRGVEEPYLLRTHGPDYLGYATSVGRFVPGTGKLDPQTRSGQMSA